MNEYATYTCDGCGRSGNADDGITGHGEPCPDDGCDGRTYPDDPKQDEVSYRRLLQSVRNEVEWTLSRNQHPAASEIEFSGDEMHVLLDAISYLGLSLPTDKSPAGTSGTVTPWEDYQ